MSKEMSVSFLAVGPVLIVVGYLLNIFWADAHRVNKEEIDKERARGDPSPLPPNENLRRFLKWHPAGTVGEHCGLVLLFGGAAMLVAGIFGFQIANMGAELEKFGARSEAEIVTKIVHWRDGPNGGTIVIKGLAPSAIIRIFEDPDGFERVVVFREDGRYAVAGNWSPPPKRLYAQFNDQPIREIEITKTK